MHTGSKAKDQGSRIKDQEAEAEAEAEAQVEEDERTEVTQAAPGLSSIKALLASINNLPKEHRSPAHWHFASKNH